MNLTCITELPCPNQKNLDGVYQCMKNEGDCEYQLLDIEGNENVGEKVKFCYSWDGEYYSGNYATEEEALKDAKFEALHEVVYIGTCTKPKLRWYGIEEKVIEQIEDNLYEDVGENAENFGVSVEDEEDLKIRLNAAIKGWIKDRNINTNCYQVLGGHRVSIEED